MKRVRSLETSAEINFEALLIKNTRGSVLARREAVGDGDGRLIALHFRDESKLDKRCHFLTVWSRMSTLARWRTGCDMLDGNHKPIRTIDRFDEGVMRDGGRCMMRTEGSGGRTTQYE